MRRVNWEELVEQYKGSSESQLAFCRRRGVSPSSFSQALQKAKTRGEFVKVPSVGQVELEVNGVQLRMSESYLGAVLRALKS